MDLLATRLMTDAARTVVGGDISTLANTSEVTVALVVAPFTPSPDTVAADLTLGAGSGLDPIVSEGGAAAHLNDPLTGARLLLINPPLGGWRWTFTGGTPVTVYGIALMTNDLADPYGTAKFSTPIQLLANGDGFVVDDVAFRMVLGSV